MERKTNTRRTIALPGSPNDCEQIEQTASLVVLPIFVIVAVVVIVVIVVVTVAVVAVAVVAVVAVVVVDDVGVVHGKSHAVVVVSAGHGLPMPRAACTTTRVATRAHAASQEDQADQLTKIYLPFQR